MLEFFSGLFDPTGFSPRWECGHWSAGLIALHVGSHVLIGLAELAIAILLLAFVRHRRELPFRSFFVWLGLFLVACALTHFLETVMFALPVYRLSGLVKLLTAIASWGTVLALVPVLPQALALRSPQELERAVREHCRDQETLRELAGTLERRVAERTAELEQQARELRDMNRALMLSNQELDEFAHIASHDLKEPLRGLANYSQFLLEDYGPQLDEEGRRKLETLIHLSRRMSELVNSLHQYSRLGRVELAVEPTDLNLVVARVLDGLRITLEEKRVEIRIPRPLPTVACDRIRVGEIFHNLITNAVKYNDKPKPWVEIGFASSTPEVFFVRDNGIGIRERHLQAIFKMFKRLHGRDQYGGGTGVGLTIARRIVERHGGRIWAESVHGEGTTFYFTLASEGEDHESSDRAPDPAGRG
jgi:signal transduction histidine kinase